METRAAVILKTKTMFLFVTILLYQSITLAHPVSFEGGTSLMSQMNPVNQEINLVYSPKWWFGTGVVFDRKTDERELTSVQFAYLAKRWNLPEAQGNLYFFGGPGYAKTDMSDPVLSEEPFYRLGFQADYETRRIYTAIRYTENRFIDDGELIYSRLRLAAGFAPYKAGYDELNSWVILRTFFDSSMNETQWVPTLRFFYKNFLWEIGQDFKGRSQFNFMVRY